jgi:hypothetical protein
LVPETTPPKVKTAPDPTWKTLVATENGTLLRVLVFKAQIVDPEPSVTCPDPKGLFVPVASDFKIAFAASVNPAENVLVKSVNVKKVPETETPPSPIRKPPYLRWFVPAPEVLNVKVTPDEISVGTLNTESGTVVLIPLLKLNVPGATITRVPPEKGPIAYCPVFGNIIVIIDTEKFTKSSLELKLVTIKEGNSTLPPETGPILNCQFELFDQRFSPTDCPTQLAEKSRDLPKTTDVQTSKTHFFVILKIEINKKKFNC